MTSLVTELAKDEIALEFFLCVEGIGWPIDENDLTAGFAGTVFTTVDYNGDLSTQLGGGVTVNLGLDMPNGVTDDFNPRTGVYSAGSMAFMITDHDEYWTTNFTPHKGSKASRVGHVHDSPLAYDQTTVELNLTKDQSPIAGDTLWIGDREAIKLGTKALVSGTRYTFTGSTRGYLGTPVGRTDGSPFRADGFGWPGGTRVYDFMRFWSNRRVILFAHVPGSAVGANSVGRVYTGRLHHVTATAKQTKWKLGTVAETLSARRWRRKPHQAVCDQMEFTTMSGNTYATAGQPVAGNNHGNDDSSTTYVGDGAATYTTRKIVVYPGESEWDHFEAIYAYNYRNRVTGGTKGAIAALYADTTTPQALLDPKGRRRIDTMVNIGGNYLFALWQHLTWTGNPPEPAYGNESYNTIQVQVVNYATGGGASQAIFAEATPIDFLLDNWADDILINRFTVNNEVTRNPIDVALIFLTSMSDEFLIGQLTSAEASASTTLAVKLGGLGTTNQWAGYALHSVNGNNVGEARVIASNTSDTATVELPFTNAPAENDEYQIRNTIYDVLPMSWGMGLHNNRIDLDSFAKVRRKYLTDAFIGRFAIGETENLDIWSLLWHNIFVPYQIYLYTDRVNGKLTCRFLGNVGLADGLDPDEDHVTVNTDDILSIGDIDFVPREAVDRIDLRVRASFAIALKPITEGLTIFGTPKVIGYEESTTPEPGIGGESVVVTLLTDDLDQVFENVRFEKLEITAMMDTVETIGDLIDLLRSKLNAEKRPYPEVEMQVRFSMFQDIQAGKTLSITDTTKENPYNSFTGSRGWTAQVGRVLGTSLQFSRRPSLTVRVQLQRSITGARIAPAAVVTSKGSDGNGAFFVVHASGSPLFSNDTADLDWGRFRVNDRIELRDATGKFREGPEVITGFGTNFVPLPVNASTGRVYISGAISATITTGDYITFSPWSTSNTTNMNLYAALADATETLGSGNDPARQYFG